MKEQKQAKREQAEPEEEPEKMKKTEEAKPEQAESEMYGDD
jgi:hypothetical protein